MPILNTNIMSDRAAMALHQSSKLSAVSMQRMSTGKAINTAGDNAAGLAISNRLSAQIKGLEQAVRNVRDGVSMAQTADGALGALSDMAQRMRELSVQAASGSLVDTDRSSLDLEFQELKRQIASLIDQTVWNGTHLLHPRLATQQSVVPAQVSGPAPIDPSLPGSGIYTLYINSEPVQVNLVQNEAPDVRLQKLVQAIEQGRLQHGASARVNAEGGLDIYTPDGRDLSVWYDDNIPGLQGSSFGLGSTGRTQVSQITLTEQATHFPTVTQGAEHVEFSGYGGSGERLSWPQTSPPSTANGVFSMSNGVLYRGDGGTAQPIGSLDPVNNGLNGKPLRVNFKASFSNSSFEENTQSAGKITGWTTLPQRVELEGRSQVGGFPTPVDTQPAPRGAGETSAVSGVSYSARVVQGPASDGSQFLELSLSGATIDPFGVLHGPAVVSDEVVPIRAGESIQFDWRPQGGADDYDVYAYLLNADTGATLELLNRTGSTTNWTTQTTTVPVTGNYKFVFVGGTYDASGGTVAGAKLDIDNIRVGSASQPFAPTAADIAAFKAQVVYSDATPFSISITLDGTPVNAGPATSQQDAIRALESQIAGKILDGTFTHLQLRRQGDALELRSAQPGVAFSLTQPTSTSHYRQLGDTLVSANEPAVDAIDAIPGASRTSTGARVFQGEPATAADLENARFIEIQAGANEGQVVLVELPDYGVPGGALDTLLWDTDGRLWAQAAVGAQGERLNAQGEAEAHIRSAAAATQGIGLLDQMIGIIVDDRAELGAKINRLTSADNNLVNMHLGQAGSRSRIQDTDFAAEASRLAKQQIIQQAATSVLAQANLNPQVVLQLLKDV